MSIIIDVLSFFSSFFVYTVLPGGKETGKCSGVQVV